MDLQETPAVPPSDEGGDERAGSWITGALLVFVGWGLAVAANIVAHRIAPLSGLRLGPIVVYPGFGPYAWATFVGGLLTGLLGLVLLYIATRLPKGPLVLPGAPG